jgi:ankyrin repeat protein
VNARGGFYMSPLVAALAKGQFKMAELLYRHGANVDVKGYLNRTPLSEVSYLGHLEMTQWLLHRGADRNAWE